MSKIISTFSRLSIMKKIAFLGSIASIIGLVVAFFPQNGETGTTTYGPESPAIGNVSGDVNIKYERPVNPKTSKVTIRVKTAQIGDMGNVSPTLCTFETPCSGLKRGSTLHLELTIQGYAAAFLQDRWGKFYNQEGRLIAANMKEGDSGLWPGIDGKTAHPVFKLWIVTSERRIKTATDATALDALPSAENGESWGPVYLSVSK